LIDPNTFSSEFCENYLISCIYDGTKCVYKLGSCTSYTNFSIAACKVATTTSSERCWQEDINSTTCQIRQCNNTITAPNVNNCALHKTSCRYNGILCTDV